MALPPLVQALTEPSRYPHPVERLEVIETHISWVILTGPYVYKFKKPVNLGFLDFSTLARRRFFCEEEVRLNRRLAPALYLGVVAVTGSPDDPRLDGSGDVIEYAVQMRQFPRESQLDRMLASGALRPAHIDAVVEALAAFHEKAVVAGEDSPFGTPEKVWAPAHQNFEQLRLRLASHDAERRERLEAWSRRAFDQLRETFERRKRQGRIRECHGDCHLGNIAWLDENALIFDGIEFSEDLRWIDVMSELAFLVMDLDDRGHPDLARRALNGYLERTGDYEGLLVLRFYLVYRALVRAKVAAIRHTQQGLSGDERRQVLSLYESYAGLAERYTRPGPSVLLITHGLAGSGKTTFTQALLESFPVVRARSDVERKRLYGLASLARSESGIASGLYAGEASRQTYSVLARLGETILRAGFAAVIDAAFLKRAQRDQLRSVARRLGVPFFVLDVHAPESVLRERVVRREREGRDASEAGLAVLEHQLATCEPVAAEEGTISVDSADPAQALAPNGQLARILGSPD